MTKIQIFENFFKKVTKNTPSKPLQSEGQKSSRTLKTEYQETKYISFGKSNNKECANTFSKKKRAIKLVCEYWVVPNKAMRTEMIMILPFSRGSSVIKPSQLTRTAQRKRGVKVPWSRANYSDA